MEKTNVADATKSHSEMNTMSLRPRKRSSLNRNQVTMMNRLPAAEQAAEASTSRYTRGVLRCSIGTVPPDPIARS